MTDSHIDRDRWVRVPEGKDGTVTLRPYCDFRAKENPFKKAFDKAMTPIIERAMAELEPSEEHKI